LKDHNPINKRSSDDPNQKKQAKHTFSFGHCEESQTKQANLAGSRQGTNSSAEIIREVRNIDSQLLQMPSNQAHEQHISFIIETSPMNT
jgi:23S rRNA maturation-related 3'-5' exoribonuclease YhaM